MSRRSIQLGASDTSAAGGSCEPRAAVAAARADGEHAIRALDLVISAVSLVALMPLLLVIAAVIRLESPGPAIFRQRRLGRSLEPFTVYKFRTMRDGVSHDAHQSFVLSLIRGETSESSNGRPYFKLSKDSRVTGVGRVLRRSSLDELPQLWNVLRGDMSLVGPRPPIPYEVDAYPPAWMARFAVKPGVTGAWQVSGRSLLSLEEMIALDLNYIQHRSVKLNLSILLRTIPTVLGARGAS